LAFTFVLFAACVVLSQILREPHEAGAGLGVILLGVPAYLLWRRTKATGPEQASQSP
jgi:hypothetical protein